jgi:valyl-tRNA synthetase
MYTPWIEDKKIQKDKEIKNVNQIIDVISKIRSFKNELNVNPGSFIDISIQNVSKEKQDLFLKNEVVLKKLGRINSIFTKDLTNESASLVISGEIFKIYFDKNIDLNLIKDNLSKKQDKLSKELEGVGKKLDNKSFIERAPNHIVEQEKNTYNELKNDIDKINLTIKSLI